MAQAPLSKTQEEHWILSLQERLLTSADLDPDQIHELSRFDRYIFSNAWEFLVCVDCEMEGKPYKVRWKAGEILGTEDYVDLEDLDALGPLPCPHCYKPLRLYHDPQVSFQKFNERLKKNACVSLLVDPNEQIQGFTYCYVTTLKRQFESEWPNRYSYMKNPPKEANRVFEHLLHCLKTALPNEPISPNMNVLCWNCIALTPEARRGKGQFKRLLGNLLNAVCPESLPLLHVGEAMQGAPFHGMLLKAGAKDVPGFLEPPETLIATPSFGTYVKGFFELWNRRP